MRDKGSLEENLIPKYRFEWKNGRERTSEELPGQNPDFVELMAELGREDPECEVTLTGYET